MTGRLYEVNACMDTVVYDVHAIDFVLSVEIGIETLLDVLNDRSPRIIIVDKVAKSWGVYHRQAEANTILLNIGTY